MDRTQSMESLDYCFPVNSYKESAVFALRCWQNVSLSEIWIPANLLSPKKKSSNSQQVNHSIYHTLQRDDATKCTESFSVYFDTKEQSGEIFQSDSDDENFFSSGNNSYEENINTVSKEENKSSEVISSYSSVKNITDHKLYENVDSSKIKHLKSNKNVDPSKIEHLKSNKNVDPSKIEHLESNGNLSKNYLSVRSKTASCNNYGNEENNSTKLRRKEVKNLTDSEISLNEILDNSSDINLKDFSFEFIKKDAPKVTDKLDKKAELNMKRVNKKERQLKKKASKTIALDEIPLYQVYEDDCANPFYKSIMQKKLLASYSAEERNNIEYPKLVVDEAKFPKPQSDNFIKFDKIDIEKNSDKGLQSVIDIIAKSTENEKEENKIESEIVMPVEEEIKTELGKMIIENIPFDVAEDDIYCILLGYGEIKNFTLEPDGKFLKAFVEMDLICNIDWIVECLNGTDPFGASTETLKCYNVTDSRS